MAGDVAGRLLRPLPIEQAARLLGAYAWSERRLFEALGAWAADEVSAAAAVLFDAQSQQHAWHAALFEERLPLLAHLPAGDVIAPPSPEVGRAMDGLGAMAGTLVRLATMARLVLPRLVAGYRAHLLATAAITDAPVVRALRLVLRDEVEAWVEAESLVQALAGAERGASLAAAWEVLGRIEASLGLSGPGLAQWPGSSPTTAP
ncbi:MAG TPA: hypothetical protein VMV14_04635 [Acidimicrobiales bacterium]|nr:hypothetical protein [Acidimicrobiales bacterium]